MWRSYPEQEDAADRGKQDEEPAERRGRGRPAAKTALGENGERAGKQGNDGTQGTSRGRDGRERGHREENARGKAKRKNRQGQRVGR